MLDRHAAFRVYPYLKTFHDHRTKEHARDEWWLGQSREMCLISQETLPRRCPGELATGASRAVERVWQVVSHRRPALPPATATHEIMRDWPLRKCLANQAATSRSSGPRRNIS